jgi:ABC-type uncharacterized transport system permease subunit
VNWSHVSNNVIISLFSYYLKQLHPNLYLFFTFQIKPCGKIAYGTTIFFLTPLQRFNEVLNTILLVLLWFIMSITTHVKDFEKQILPLSRHIKIKNLTFLTGMLISKHVPFFSKTTKDPFGTKLTLKFYLGWRRCPLPCILHPIWYALKKCW